jgi:hypothetical protein
MAAIERGGCSVRRTARVTKSSSTSTRAPKFARRERTKRVDSVWLNFAIPQREQKNASERSGASERAQMQFGDDARSDKMSPEDSRADCSSIGSAVAVNGHMCG